MGQTQILDYGDKLAESTKGHRPRRGVNPTAANGAVEVAAQEAHEARQALAGDALDYGAELAESTNGHRPRRRFDPAAANGAVEAAAQEEHEGHQAPAGDALDYGAELPESTNGHRPRRRFDPAAANGAVEGAAQEVEETPPVDAPASPRPFPLMDRAMQAAVAGEAYAGSSDSHAVNGYSDALDLRRRHRAAHRIVLDSDSEAVRDGRRRERIYRRMLVASDAVTAAGAGLIAIELLGGYQLRALYLLVVPLMVLGAKVGGLYDKDELVIDHSTLNELPRLLNLATMFALLVWISRHYVVLGAPTTRNLLTLWALLTGGLVAGRSIARKLARQIAPVERCLLVGRRAVFQRLEDKFRAFPRVRLIGVVRTTAIASDPTQLREIAERDNIQRIIIDTDATAAATTLELVRAANATGLQVSLLPSMLGAVGGSVVFDDIGGLMLMGVPRFGLSRSSKALKRIFDLVGASAGLVIATPLMVLCAIAIKLTSLGPVLFRQTRIGRDGTPFKMLKLRTMVDGADALKDSLRHENEADGLFKIDDDPRITRVGKRLRRSGVDELPQLFNVLAGSMSLVGPRPLVIDEDDHVTGFDRDRLALTPGITGRWQTLGAARVPLAEMVKIDYLYIANWSLWSDFKIILETVSYLAHGRGQ